MLQSIKSVIEAKMSDLIQADGSSETARSAAILYRREQVLCIADSALNQGYQMMTRGQDCHAPSASVAAEERSKIWGDPHFEGGDGDRFDVQGEAGKSYHLLSDTGLRLNGYFAAYSEGKTVVGKSGLTLTGPRGKSRILVQARPETKVCLDGRTLLPGQCLPTADGGQLKMSTDGNLLSVTSAEGYRIEQEIKHPGASGELEIRVFTPRRGVAQDARLPQGLLGQTFDADHDARMGRGNNGEGAIAGIVSDYEVAGGVFGEPKGIAIASPQNLDGLRRFFTALQIPTTYPPKFPLLNPVTCQKIDWAEEIRQETLDSLQRNSLRAAKQQALCSNAETNRLAHLLQMALCSGNISLAMMIFSHLEARSANELTRGLMNKMQSMQDKKRELSSQIQGQKDDAEGSKNIQKIRTDMEQVTDDMSVLQTFIRDVAQNKQQSLELANAFISKEHESTMAILRSWSH